MNEQGPAANGLRFQVADHERRLERLERYEPAVVARTLQDAEEDLKEVRTQLKWMTRALIGAMLTLLATLATVLLVFPHG